MRNKSIFNYFLFVNNLLILLCFTNIHAAGKALTFLTYIAANNNLASAVNQDLAEMMSIDNPNINILAYVCSNSMAQKVLITKNKATVLSTEYNVDSGKEETFTKACMWAVQDFPSDKLALVAWNHGSGPLNRCPRGICYDDNTGSYLTDLSLMKSLDTIVKYRGGKKVDLFGFDACLMQGVEILASLAPYVSLVAASQQTIPNEGWDYSALNTVPKFGAIDMRAFARSIVQYYFNFYAKRTNDFTLSAIDLSLFNNINLALNDISNILIQCLNNQVNGSVKKAIGQSVNKYFEESTYMDLIGFCNKLYQSASSMRLKAGQSGLIQQLRNSLQVCIAAVQASMVANTKGSKLSGANGLSIYFPSRSVEPSYLKTYWSVNNKWATFVQKYMSSSGSLIPLF